MKTPEELAEEYALFGKSDVPNSVFKSQKIAEQKFDFLAGYKAAQEQTNLPTPAKWISVKERLPEGGKVVLVAMPKGTVTLGGIHKKTQTFDVFLDMAILTAQPTHWMSLPEPPREEK